MKRARWAAKFCFALTVAGASGTARAACQEPGPYVVLNAATLESDARDELARHLTAQLRASQIALCSETSSHAPVARLEVTPEPGTPQAYRLALQDQVTGKTLLRVMDLRSIPENGRALALSIAADELLRASWAELALAQPTERRRAVPREVARVAARDRQPTRQRRRAWLSAGFLGEFFPQRAIVAGPELGGGVLLSPRLGLNAKVGIQRSAPISAQDGSISLALERAELALLYGLKERPWRLAILAGGDIARVRVSGDARAGAIAYSGVALASTSYVGSSLALPLSARTAFGLAAKVGYTLHAVHALDGAETRGSLSGLYSALSCELTVDL